MISHSDKPPRRFIPVLAAAVLGAVVAAILPNIFQAFTVEETWNIVVASQKLSFFCISYGVALAHAIVFGVPIFFALWRNRRIGIVSCGGAGFLIGALPLGVLMLISMLMVQNSSIGNQPTVVNHVPTLRGWIDYALGVGGFGLVGLAGGLTFWGVIRWYGMRPLTADEDKDEPRPSSYRSVTVALLAVLLTGTIFSLPYVVRDRTCHTLFRDNRSPISMRVGADMGLATGDWDRLKQTLVKFAQINRLEFREDQHIQNGQLMWRTLDLCSEDGITIFVQDQPWLAYMRLPPSLSVMQLRIYELKPESNWRSLAQGLVDKLEGQWRGKFTYRGPRGEAISLEEAMKER